MRVLSLIHQYDAPLGVFAGAIKAAGAQLEEASFALDRPPARPPSDYDATIVLGGAVNVDEADRNPWMDGEKALVRELVERRLPVLGVCLGAQLLAEAAGAEVGPLAGGPEIGWHEVDLLPDGARDPVLGTLPPRFLAFEWHGYGAGLAPGAVELARNSSGLQAFSLGDRPAWGIQFHAEVDRETVDGWIDRDPDDVDPQALKAQSARELPRWNELGRKLCEAFLAEAASRC
jgi:GMP synthase-like glutamine amidotransferase